MEENHIIASSEKPVTVQSLVKDLKRIGVLPGMTLLVHSSLSSLGWVCGGSVAVVLALEEALGPEGTLVVPTHTSNLCDPKGWCNPPVPQTWWETIRNNIPAFNQQLTPTLGMGVIPETFRKQEGVVRSLHPQTSFAAIGPNATYVTEDHSLDFGLGEGSPLARLYDLNASILLLGVFHDKNTSLHLAEHRAEYSSKAVFEDSAPILVDNEQRWVQFKSTVLDESDFAQMGESFEKKTKFVQVGKIGNANSRLMPQPACVDFAVQWIEANR